MKPVFVSLLSVAAAFSQTTTVTQSVLDATGNPANGTVLIRLSAACESGSTYVSVRTIRVSFTGGNFSIALVPNDTCVPAGTQLPGGT
jgi:hypothetical protein